MALPSTYHLRNSLPNRSPSSRPRSLSLAEYQPLTFDREALESAYQSGLQQAASSSTSWQSHPSSTQASVDTHETISTSPSTLSGHLKAGDNPHLPPPPPFPGTEDAGGFAGVGAGHSLTPPGSPFHKHGQLQSQALVSPNLPTPPTTTSDHFHEPMGNAGHVDNGGRKGKGRSGRGVSHDYGAGLDLDDFEAAGYDTDPGPVVTGLRRALPPVPTNVPPPQLPRWEPDYKAHIPPELTQPSIQDAYAQLSAPPPNLPPRRYAPTGQGSSSGTYAGASSSHGPGGVTGGYGVGDAAGSSSLRPPAQTALSSSTVGSGSTALPPGAPEYPPQQSSGSSVISPASSTVSRPRPEAEKEVTLRATERTPIWSTHYLDPCLRNALVNLPQQVSNITNIALSSLSSGPRERYDSTIGAPIDGLARMAKDWVVAPDGRFHSENGGIELAIGVIDSGMQGWGRDKGRKRARVEVISKSGGIKVDVIELEASRQIDLKIETKTGDVLVLLPDNFHGPIHVNSPARPPIILPIIQPQLLPLANPYNTFYTTFAVPLAFVRDPHRNNSVEHRAMSNIERHVPAGFREESEFNNQVAGGFASHNRGDQSKILITSQKGRVVIGYRESKDEQAAAGMDLKVGAQAGGKKKRWWR